MWELGDHAMYGNLSRADLRVDQAYLNLTSTASKRLYLYSLSDDCIQCPWSKWRDIPAQRSALVKFNTAHGLRWRIFDADVGPLAFDIQTSFASIEHPDVGEFGVYGLACDNEGCSFSELSPAVNIYFSILYFLLIAVGVGLLINLSHRGLSKFRQRPSQRRNTEESPVVDGVPTATSSVSSSVDNELDKPPVVRRPSSRLRSLDTFRGAAIVLMIFVNSGGGHYWWMEHATWNGLHVADVVFPCFLWIMGVCLPMAIRSQAAREVSRGRMITRVAVRSLKLFLVGLFLNTASGPPLEQIRVMGVLQRFGIAYFVVATLHILLRQPIVTDAQEPGRVKRALNDVLSLWSQWLVALAFVALYLGLTFGLPVPGCPRGYLGPGGKHDWATHRNCTGGANGYIDRVLIGNANLYQWGTARSTYDSQIFDPEGLFGCLLTCVQVFLGVQCGTTLMVYTDWKERTKRWLMWAAVCGLLGGILAGFSQDGGWVPVNKNMWSLSFVLVTSAIAFGMLTLMYVLVDVTAWWTGAPLRWAGMNAIVMYVGHEVLHRILPFRWHIGSMNTHFVLLLENGWNAALWVFVAWYMHRKKVYVSL